jgi:hypothetical protein
VNEGLSFTQQLTKENIGVKGLYMKEKMIVRIASCLCIVLMASTAFAQQGKKTSGPYQGPMMPLVMAPDAPDAVFYTNFEANTCTGCNYSSANGFLLLGPNNCYPPFAGATQWLAYPFVSTRTGNVRRVTLAITDWSICTPTSHQFSVAIYTDACGMVPGTQIGNVVKANAAPAPCGTASANFANAGVSLTAGNKYWVVVTLNNTAQQNATTAVWWETNPAEGGFNLNDGNGWVAGPTGAPGAFSVQ